MTATSTQLTRRSGHAQSHPNDEVQRLRSFNRAALEALRERRFRLVRLPSSTFSGMFTPRMDICDDPASPNITATFELPGVKREEIKLNIHEGNLIVRGERRSRLTPLTTRPSNGISSLPVHPISAADTIASGEMMETDAIALPVKYPVQEVRYGKFHRAVALPQGAKHSDITALMQEGMLTVTWPRNLAPNAEQQAPFTVPGTESASTLLDSVARSGRHETAMDH